MRTPVLLIAAGVLAAAVAAAPPASAEGCGHGGGFGSGGGYCDYDYLPDGSHMHCESVYVLGFGGENCFRVYPPAPQEGLA